MTVPSYTEEDVELVISELPVDPFDGTIPVEYDDHGIPCWGQPQKVARAVLAALSSAGRLVPPGSEERRKVVQVWYRSLQADGKVWCETRNPREVVELSQGVADRFEQLVISQVEGPWSPWSPSVPDTKEGS